MDKPGFNDASVSEKKNVATSQIIKFDAFIAYEFLYLTYLFRINLR